MPNIALGSTLTQVHMVSSSPTLSLMQTSVQIGRAAKDIQTTLESSLHNVAENIEGAFGNAERG